MKPKKWTTKSLGEISKFKSGGTPSKSNPNFWGGDIPWVTAKDMKTPLINNSIDKLTPEALKVAKLAPCETLLILVRGMTLHKDLPLAITTRELAFNQDIKALTTCKEVLPMFLMVYLSSQKHKILQLVDSAGHGTGRLDTELLKSFPINYPTIFEQKQIVGVLATWESAIEKTEALITAKEKQFEWLTSNLINRAGYKRTAASGLMTEVSKRNKNSTIERVLSVTNHSGFVLPEEQFERRVASANVSNYKVVEQGQYAYNPSRINVGSIARLDDWENGILSPMYVVFKLDTKKVCSDYFLHWLNSSEARQRIKNSAQGSVRETVSFKDLGAIDIPLPAMDVQKDVTYKLNLAQKEISLLKKTLEQYRSQKRGLMQKLLTGEWQVGSSQLLSEETCQELSREGVA